MPANKEDGKTSPAPKQEPAAGLPNRDQLVKAVAVQQKIAKAQAYAKSLRDKASTVTDPKERERLIKEAYDKEVEAHGNSKFARRLQSGPWQGAAAGGGIGLGTGLGLGTVVGALVGGLLSIPTTGLGALIGTGVGAINGPFIKLGGKDTKWTDASPEQVVDAIEKECAGQQELPPPQQDMSSPSIGDAPPSSVQDESKPRKKPRKIEIRSQQSRSSGEDVSALTPETRDPTTAPTVENNSPRRPKKIQSRTQSQQGITA